MVARAKATPTTEYRDTHAAHDAFDDRQHDEAWQKQEWLTCAESPLYFAYTYCKIYDALAGDWIPFKLWPAQAQVLKDMQDNLKVVILKARQLGVTWLALSFALWLMIFHPAATILLFSRRDDEAIELLEVRLKGMYERLPTWMQAEDINVDNKHEFALSNGSRAISLPSNGGDSYTATLVIADEFDLVQDQRRLLGGMKPTIDNGGRLILLSRPDKSRPQTPFKSIYRAAKTGDNGYKPVFMPWSAHPRRTCSWYDKQKKEAMSQAGAVDENTPGALDDLHEQYPATDVEALAARTGDKRLASKWLNQCYSEKACLSEEQARQAGVPSIPGLRLYALPQEGLTYVIGGDPAEGNPTSDDSALTVRCRETGDEVASLAGKFQPTTFAAHIDAIGVFFNNADVMPERNNHGHAVIAWLDDNSGLRVLTGFDDKPGWHSTTKGKSLLYDAAADAYRYQEVTLHTFATQVQLESIEGSTLRAPDGLHDDLADSDALSIVGILEPAISPDRLLPTLQEWHGAKESLPDLHPKESLVLAVRSNAAGDYFLLGVTRHPDGERFNTDVAVRVMRVWRDAEEDALLAVETTITELCQSHKVITVLGDPRQLHDLMRRLRQNRDARTWVQDFPQDTRRQTADAALYALLSRAGVAHDGNDLLATHINNADRKMDDRGRPRIVARSERQPIDLVDCLSMAADECLRLNARQVTR